MAQRPFGRSLKLWAAIFVSLITMELVGLHGGAAGIGIGLLLILDTEGKLR